MRLDSQENVQKWLNGEYKHEYEPAEGYIKSWNKMYEKGFLYNYIVYSFSMTLVTILFHILDYGQKRNNLIEELIIWSYFFPLILVGGLWLKKPKNLNNQQ